MYRLWYYVPAAALAGLVVAERFTSGWRSKASFGLDLLVAASCLARPIFEQPPLSGHALFSVFAFLTCRMASSRIAAIAVLLITLFAKIVLWNFDPTLLPGLAAGMVAGIGWRLLEKAFYDPGSVKGE